MENIDKKLQIEIDFIESIDACFPFRNKKEAREIVSKGAAISDNAALKIGHELASEPVGRYTSIRLSLWDQLCRERPTKAVQVAAPIVDSLIRGTSFSERAIEQLLEYCRNNKGCYNALEILGCCSKELDEEANKILASW